MKKISLFFGIFAAAAMTLVSCDKEIDNYTPEVIEEEGVPFEIVANPATKTTIAGYDISWAADDAINLYHAEEGYTDIFTSDGKFTIAEEDLADGTFKGTLDEKPVSGNYDWYAFYPYVSAKTSPSSLEAGYTVIGAKTGVAQTQTGNNSTAHLAGANYPLSGKVTGVAFDQKPSMNLKSVCSFVKINVTNNAGAPITISSIRFTAPEVIVGEYFMDITDPSNVVYAARGDQHVSETAILKVNDGEVIDDGASAAFYIGVKPFVAPANTSIAISVNGYDRVVNLTSDVTFHQGKVKTVNFNYDEALTGNEYEKVTSITAGDYLIVYEGEDGGIAFNGALGTLDAVSNTIPVVIANDKIVGTETTDAAQFTIAAIDGGYSIRSASGKYIGQTSDANGLASGESAYINVITFDEGNANIVSGGAYLRFNSASNQNRFRYYKSSSYSGQKPVALYKRIGSEPVIKQDAEVTIIGTIPTEPMETDDTFEFSATTTSDATEFVVELSPDGAATVAAKPGVENTWVVTAGEPNADTEVTLTVSVAETATCNAASDSKTFTVKKGANVVDLDFTSNVVYTAGANSQKQSIVPNGQDAVDFLKLGTSTKEGVGTITVPAGSTKLTFFAIAWSGVEDAEIHFEQEGVELTDIVEPNAHEGFSGSSSTYTINDITTADLYEITLNSDSPVTVNGYRRVGIFGAKGNGTGGTKTTIQFASDNVELELGSEKTVTATVIPANAVVTYSSSAPTLVAVESETGKITCGAAAYVGATATITASVEELTGEYTSASASYTVTIIAASNEDHMEAAETVTLAYEETFLSSIGKFNVYDQQGISGKDVWTQSTQYGMVAKAYIDGTRYQTVSWLYSPDINLGNAVEPTLTFSHAGRYLGAVTDVSLWVRESQGEWAQVPFSGDVTNSNFNYVDNTIDLSAYSGKTIQIAFKYTSTTTAAGTYEVKNFKVEDANAPKFNAVINNTSAVPAAGGTKTITVTGNVAWTASATNGATLSSAAGTGDGTITVTIPENTSTEAGKSYTVTVSASGFENKVFDIEQVAASGGGDPTDWSAVYTSNVTLTAGSNGSTAKVVIGGDQYDAIKVGTSKNGGDMKITVPANTTKLYVHAAAWKGVTGLSLSISGATVSPASLSLTPDEGISNNSPFTFSGDPSTSDYFFELTLSGVTAETELTFSASKRFVIWGCNAE